VEAPESVAEYLLNRKRKELARLEEGGLMIHVHPLHGVSPEHLELRCLDKNDNEITLIPSEPMPRPRMR
jgi:hypothetical protein